MSISRPTSIARARALALPADRAHRIALAGAGLLAALAAATITAPRLHAQAAATRAPLRVSVTPYAGYFVAGSFFDGPVGTSLASASSAIYGGQLTLPLTSSIAVIGNAGYANGDLQVGLPFVGGISVGSVSSLLYDAGLELRSPAALGASRSITPFVQGGVGGIRREVEVSGLTTKATGLAWNAGLGADVQFTPAIGMRLLAKDYIGKFDFKEAIGFDLESKTSHSWALTAGLKLSF